MAIDTIAKRYSALNFASITDDLLPVPSGSIGLGDQATVLALYGGIALDPPTEVEGLEPAHRLFIGVGIGL